MNAERSYRSSRKVVGILSFLLAAGLALPGWAVMPEASFLGTVTAKEPEGQLLIIQVESSQWLGAEWEPVSLVIEAPAPNEDAWNGIEVGDRVEAGAFGSPDEAPAYLRSLGKLSPSAEPCLTDVYGDPNGLCTEWAAECTLSFSNEPNLTPCNCCLCTAVASSVSIGETTYRLLPGETVIHEDGQLHVDVTFHEGEAYEPDCFCPGPQAVSDFTIHVRRDDGVPFSRGDANADGSLNVTDAVVTLLYLFQGGFVPPCLEAANSNDDAGLDLSDAVYVLQFLFVGGELVPPPFPGCGPDPTVADLTCDSFAPCE